MNRSHAPHPLYFLVNRREKRRRSLVSRLNCHYYSDYCYDYACLERELGSITRALAILAHIWEKGVQCYKKKKKKKGWWWCIRASEKRWLAGEEWKDGPELRLMRQSCGCTNWCHSECDYARASADSQVEYMRESEREKSFQTACARDEIRPWIP